MRRIALIVSCSALAIVCAQTGSLLQQAPAKFAAKTNSLENDPQAPRAGAKLYARECASCHGAAGQGIGKAPALRRPDVEIAPAGALFWVLENGSMHHGMPSFAHLPEAQRWQIVSFLRAQAAAEERK